MRNRKSVLWITQTAVFIALLVSAQAFTRPFGQFVTGSCVNFILASSCILVGLASAALVAVLSPVFAFIVIGIPVFPILIPFIIAGNIVFVVAIHFISGKFASGEEFADLSRRFYVRAYVAGAGGSILKFLVLWIGIVKIALALIPDAKQPQIDAMAATFSWPQLVTALIGSSIAIMIMPRVTKALRSTKRN